MISRVRNLAYPENQSIHLKIQICLHVSALPLFISLPSLSSSAVWKLLFKSLDADDMRARSSAYISCLGRRVLNSLEESDPMTSITLNDAYFLMHGHSIYTVNGFNLYARNAERCSIFYWMDHFVIFCLIEKILCQIYIYIKLQHSMDQFWYTDR